MRVTVGILGFGEQGTGLGELLQHTKVGRSGFLGREILDGFQSGQADQIGGNAAIIEVFSVVANRAVDLQAVFQSGHVVILTVAGSGMDGAGAAFRRDIIGEYDRRGAVNERVAGLESL